MSTGMHSKSNWDTLQICVFCTAIVSFIGSVLVILTYFVSKRWRNELNDMKKVLLFVWYVHNYYHIYLNSIIELFYMYVSICVKKCINIYSFYQCCYSLAYIDVDVADNNTLCCIQASILQVNNSIYFHIVTICNLASTITITDTVLSLLIL